MREPVRNPFKFGSIVETPYFTDRVAELKEITVHLEGPNHLVLISPRRFGKTSLIIKALKASGRPYILLNLQQALSVRDLAQMILKSVFELKPWERIRSFLQGFRVMPTITFNPMNGETEVSFGADADPHLALEDALGLLDRIGSEESRLIFVLDEFQEVRNLEEGLDRKLRSIMQTHRSVNYVFLGSQESMMRSIFDSVRSPFFHFARLMQLGKIPHDDFALYLRSNFQTVCSQDVASKLAEEVLGLTRCHPHNTQYAAALLWDRIRAEGYSEGLLSQTVERVLKERDDLYERLWLTFVRTDRQVLQSVAQGLPIAHGEERAQSTYYAAARRLLQAGWLIRTDRYEIEDPFFEAWMRRCRSESALTGGAERDPD